MGSKKLKKKKLKSKKLKKLKLIKQKRLNKRNESEEMSDESSCDRLTDRNGRRSYEGGKCISKIKNFSHIREDYFSYLQKVIESNCIYCDSFVTDEMLENLALELEQYALLACLQADIYEKSMTKIISDIKKCTAEKQVHEEVKKLLPDATQKKTNQVKTENPETYSKIPTISTMRTDDDDGAVMNGDEWAEYEDRNYSQYPEPVFENHNEPNHWNGGESYSAEQQPPDYWGGGVVQQNKSNFLIETVQNNFSDENKERSNKSEAVDHLLVSRSQLSKRVEETLSQCERVNKERRDEKERAYIAHILEGDDSLDEKLNDSLSDNEAESKENIDESLTDRLEKMRELFGVEEEETTPVQLKGKSKERKQINPRGRRPTIWRHERVIQLHKLSLLTSEMSQERREANRKLFVELFGEDSDEEHEGENLCEGRFRASCTERISSWVVKYLMPFYHERRILGRKVFKSLGHHISDAIIGEIQYPDEWTVKYFVSKFFPPRKKYSCDADVLAFQLE